MTIYTFQDASTWDVPGDTVFLTFASPEDAKKAEGLFRRIQDEAYANGYATALETAAQVADEMDCAMLCGVGREVGGRIRSISTAPKPHSPTGDEGRNG